MLTRVPFDRNLFINTIIVVFVEIVRDDWCIDSEYIPIFIKRKMYGNDQCKKSNDPIPEPMGVICAAVYLIVMFLFIPFPFVEWLGTEKVFNVF
ncbi:hypothetical protein RB195_013288 [Necator americanus]|uniref:Uncharacterized protein n=1 Tax=Necator americanus TaxID=51031 RepID=A0ABR1DVH0_NECAM